MLSIVTRQVPEKGKQFEKNGNVMERVVDEEE